jgi:hypothetical protein
MSMFQQPSAPGGGIAWADHKGALLLIDPHEFRAGISTAFGEADAVEADVHVLAGPGQGEVYIGTLIFPKLLVSQLKGEVGKRILGRLGQGTAKSGQSAPWVLNEATPEDIRTAETWVRTQTSGITSAEAPF